MKVNITFTCAGGNPTSTTTSKRTTTTKRTTTKTTTKTTTTTSKIFLKVESKVVEILTKLNVKKEFAQTREGDFQTLSVLPRNKMGGERRTLYLPDPWKREYKLTRGLPGLPWF